MTKIKLCGMTRMEDIETVNEIRPDFCGFVIEVPKSRRNVSIAQAEKLSAALASEIVPVGVFVNAPVDLVAALLNDGVIKVAQLHGQEGEDYIECLRAKMRPDETVIQAFSIRTKGDIWRAKKSSADLILLDQGSGGSGKAFDWSLIENVGRPFFLAGGLGNRNLAQAIREVKPWAVDLSSALETDGLKDPEKMREAVRIVRRIKRADG